MRGADEDPDYPHYEQPYRLLNIPFIDQTFTTELRRNEDNSQTDARYTAFLTGDFLNMESSLYLSIRKQDPTPGVRFTLSRHAPLPAGTCSAPSAPGLSSSAVSRRPVSTMLLEAVAVKE